MVCCNGSRCNSTYVLIDLMDRQNVRHLITRLSFAVVFIGIGIWEIVQPSYWSFYVPSILAKFANANLITMVQGAALIVIGGGVLTGAYLKIFAALGVLMMIAILTDLIVSFGFTDLIIRDSGVLLIALALYFDDTKYLRLTK